MKLPVRMPRFGITAALIAAPLVATPVSIVATAAPASASCIYNVGPSGQSLAFSSNDSWTGGYSSENLAGGSSQCWYGVGWSNGIFTFPDSLDLAINNPGSVASTLPNLNVEAHGWINAVVCSGYYTQPPSTVNGVPIDMPYPPGWFVDSYAIYSSTGVNLSNQALPPYQPGCIG